MMNALYVSLGHNSSAVYAKDGLVIRGYEQERIDRRKSSSAYPHGAIEAAMRGSSGVDVVCVSHWFDQLRLENNKYLDLDHLKQFSDNVVSLSVDCTHHDAHARSAVAFSESNGLRGDATVIVLDGFGTLQECFSLYDVHSAARQIKLRHRTYGYAMSLGLMYQYATEYLGLKPNQDEYKLLGYESLAREFVDRDHLLTIRRRVADQAVAHAMRMLESTMRPTSQGSLIDYAALHEAKQTWTDVAHRWRQMFPDVKSDKGVRAVVAFCAQSFLEACAEQLVDELVDNEYGHVVLTGGCFYNVKLNRTMQLATGLPTFAHPLCGDQGAAMGVYDGSSSTAPAMYGLCVGQRDIKVVPEPVGAFCVTEESWVETAGNLLSSGKIVNVVRGAMEYGPRALCNTTTFALPTLENVRRINELNERDDAMPMAPVMTRAAAQRLLSRNELDRSPVCDQFMITTVAYVGRPADDLMGVAHRDPILDLWTARPQVTHDPDLVRLLRGFARETLINTSFNYHGEPIVMTQDDAMKTHAMQRFRATVCGLPEPVTLMVRP